MRGKRVCFKVLLVTVLSCMLWAAGMAVTPAGEVNASCGRPGWYFAEGYTGGDFDTWILIQNPNQTDTVAHLRFFTNSGEPIPWDVNLEGESRKSVYLNTVPGLEGQEVATEVICDGEGVIAERAMYFNYDGGEGSRVGGHSTIGADGLNNSWYLPEGYTGGSFDTYVLLMNPGDTDANVQVKLMKPEDGRYYPFKTVVPAGRRQTVKLDELVWVEGQENVIADAGAATGGGEPAAPVTFEATNVSTWVYADRPVMAERAMYFDYYGKAGGSSSIGAKYAATEWYLPEGYTGGDFDTWVMAMNPNSYPVDITYTFYTNAPGAAPVSVTHPGVARYSRDTINVDEVPGLEGTEVSTKVTAVRPVQLAEAEDDPIDRYAVVFGIEDYPSGADLLYAEDDAVDVKHRLAEQGDFCYHYKLGANATKANLAAEMAWLADTADANDIALIFFAGRSSTGTEMNVDLYDGSVSRSELEAYFSAMRSEKFVGMFSCDDAGKLAADLAAPGRILLASCADGEDSHEYPDGDFNAATGDYGNGAWAYYFVEALGKKEADANGNGYVSAEEAHLYLGNKVTTLVLAEDGISQVPEVYDQVVNQVDLTVDKVPASVVAERSVYFNYQGCIDGATSIGASQVLPNWFLAEGYTGGAFDTYVLVMNPYGYRQKLTVTFMTPGGEPIVKEYYCEPYSRKTIMVDEVPGLEAMDVSTRVSASPAEVASAGACGGVVVERAMYFTYVDPVERSLKAGGSCSIGYGSW